MEPLILLIQDLQEFFRRRGNFELDYSKKLETLKADIILRNNEHLQSCRQTVIIPKFACWRNLVHQIEQLSRQHTILSELYANSTVYCLQKAVECIKHIYDVRKSRAEENKDIVAELYQNKLQSKLSKNKLEGSKKFKGIEIKVSKKSNKSSDVALKHFKAQCADQLYLEAPNMTVHKYYADSLCDLINNMEFAFRSMISTAIFMHVLADQERCKAIAQQSGDLSQLSHGDDTSYSRHTTSKLFQFENQFCSNYTLQLKNSNILQLVNLDIEARLHSIKKRLHKLRVDYIETKKAIETFDTFLYEYINNKESDNYAEYIYDEKNCATRTQNSNIASKLRNDRHEMQNYYVTKIRGFLKGTSSRTDKTTPSDEFFNISSANSTAWNSALQGNIKLASCSRIEQKLFGGSLEEYINSTGQDVPLIMRSCIRVIKNFGLHHHGIFRVSGSQVEINNYRERFESGEDPLTETCDASDINSIAGVLKLYLRELREPLFPISHTKKFLSTFESQSENEITSNIKQFVYSLPKPTMIVIRYLFAFLNHLSEYADVNMMNAYNLAICFGPTLMPSTDDKYQIKYQNQVNELVKNMILNYGEIFTEDFDGLKYIKDSGSKEEILFNN